MEGNELNELRELVEFLRASEIAEFAYEKGDLKLGLKFAGAIAPAMDMARLAQLITSAQPASTQPPLAQVAHTHPTPDAIAPAAAVAPEEKNHIVKSPIVGTFYDSPSPGAPAFVKIGDTVEVGQVLCIVEAMKLMNEIESDAAGVVVERIMQGGQPVEYGQPLFAIKAK